MFWSKNKKKVYPCKPQFYYIKVGCKGVFVTQTCFRDADDLKSTQFAGEVMRPPETTYCTPEQCG